MNGSVQDLKLPSDLSKLSDDDIYKLWQDSLRNVLKTGSIYSYDNLANKREDTKKYLKRVGIYDRAIELPVIHVTGTKGKGSTCTFTESILRTCGYKTGLLTSPPILDVRERIQMCGGVLPKRKFSEYALQVLDLLVKTPDAVGEEASCREADLYAYFFVLSLYIFLEEKVDVVIIEVFIGGENDYTNIFKAPAAVGITNIELDHVDLLGDSVEKIAWKKCGLAKPGCPVFMVRSAQHPGVLDALSKKTHGIGARLYTCPLLVEYGTGGRTIELGLEGDHQHINAAMAVKLARTWIEANDPGKIKFPECEPPKDVPMTGLPVVLPEQFIQGLKEAYLPGHAQVIRRNHVTFYCDTSSTVESITRTRAWFESEAGKERERLIGNGTSCSRVMIFSQLWKSTSKQSIKLLSDVDFDAVVCCPSWETYGQYRNSNPRFFNGPNRSRNVTTTEMTIENSLKCKKTFDDIVASKSPSRSMITKATSTLAAALKWSIVSRDDLPSNVLAIAESAKMSPVIDNGGGDQLDVDDHVQVLVTGNIPTVALALLYFNPSCLPEQ